MDSNEIGNIVLTLCVLLALVHSFAYIFEKLKQPRLVGEILSGIVLGPFIFGYFFPDLAQRLFGITNQIGNKTDTVLNFLYWIGLFLLMFLSGAETRRLMARENQKETIWLFSVGVIIPFALILFFGHNQIALPLEKIIGSTKSTESALLVLAIAVTVTSIPVISRIFMDLKIIHTRFASLILGFAVLEDIILWAALAVATSIGVQATTEKNLINNIATHITITFIYMGIGLTFAPRILQRLHNRRWNLLIKASPVGYLFFILFIYAAIASLFDVNLVFAAFLAGFGVVGGITGDGRSRFALPLEAIANVAKGVFIPIYFSLVGFKLVFGPEFDFSLLVSFFLLSSLIAVLFFSLASYLAGFRGLDIINLSITKNARGGPGIVLASVAYEAGIINGAFYTTLVLTAVFTSQIAGIWLRFVLSKSWPLLTKKPKLANE
ncbi:MAG: cation:proton antiporter [Oligoflexia bacterium]|nr:cation:proton antiporter [Oligoflexia bacterium]